MAQTQKLLEIQNVSKIFRIGGMLMGKKLTAIDDVSLDIDAGKPVILSIVGESGCGKSTLCKMILRLYKPDMGDIRLLGNSYADKKAYNPKQFKLDVQPIFQNPYESFSARKTVDTYLFNTALRLGICKNHAEAEKVVDETLRSVGMSLAVVKDKYPTQFSGGELQRVSIARALITRPKLIIADEPVAAIDASMKMNIVNLFKDLKDQYNVSFIYITHDLSTAYYVSDYIATLYRGGLIEYGPAQGDHGQSRASVHRASDERRAARGRQVGSGNGHAGHGGQGVRDHLLQVRAPLPVCHGRVPQAPAGHDRFGRTAQGIVLPLPRQTPVNRMLPRSRCLRAPRESAAKARVS